MFVYSSYEQCHQFGTVMRNPMSYFPVCECCSAGTITQGICELLLTVVLLIGSGFNNLWHVRSSYAHWHEMMLDFPSIF